MPRNALFAAAALAFAAVPLSAQSPLPVTAPAYLEGAARGDIFEITSSQIALQRSQDRMVRDHAMTMISDHTLTTNRALAVAAEQGITPPPAVLDAQQRQMITQLLGASGAEFDRLYWQMQRSSHQQALSLQQNYARNGDLPALRDLAARIAPVVQEHLRMAQRHAGM